VSLTQIVSRAITTHEIIMKAVNEVEKRGRQAVTFISRSKIDTKESGMKCEVMSFIVERS